MDKYREFIASKKLTSEKYGFKAETINPLVKYHQKVAIEYALEKGRSACFLDTGLGKSFVELEFANQVAQETNKPVLILTPLAVAGQMIREGNKFNIDARQVKDKSEVGAGIMVCNYERLHNLDVSVFGGVVLDESSILKSFNGKTKRMLVDAFNRTEYRMAATATPSPNDHMELGNHADFLGIMPSSEMLSRWFMADQTTMGGYRLKNHGQEKFWSWIASWSRAATLPSDLGGDDTGYILPEVERKIHMVQSDRSIDSGDMLFRIPEMSATSFHKEKRLTIDARCERAAELATHDKPVTVWCETNAESTILAKLIPDAMEVHGGLSADEKEKRLLGFADGDFRVMVTKPKLAGFGVNWQHCAHAVFASISFSYEQHYQAVRRSHRFGQTETVKNDIVISDTERSVWDIVNVKAEKHLEMKKNMSKAMIGAMKDSELRVAYGNREKINLPDWIK